MADIDDLQIELDSLLCSQSVENLAELCKNHLKLEIPADIKSKGKLIKFIRKNVEKTLETELETMTHEQFLQNIMTCLTIDPPPLEKDNTEEEINDLEKLYNELKGKQETELQELKAKLIEAKKKVTKSCDIEPGEMAYKSETEIAKESAKFPVTNETEHEKYYLIRRF